LFRSPRTRNSPNQNARDKCAKTSDQKIKREDEPPATDDHYGRYEPQDDENQNFRNDERKDDPFSHATRP
jgi:hypothetical protein